MQDHDLDAITMHQNSQITWTKAVSLQAQDKSPDEACTMSKLESPFLSSVYSTSFICFDQEGMTFKEEYI